jgi:parvulin-like peptidyl-prolyl isomerase
LLLGPAACRSEGTDTPPSTGALPSQAAIDPTGAATSTEPEVTPSPSPTPVPLAARVNGLEISLAEYQAELALYKAAKGTELAAEDEKRVLDDLIDRALLAQAAQEEGFSVDEARLQERIAGLVTQLGNEQALKDWYSAYGYDEGSFRQALSHSIAAAWKRDRIAAALPKTSEQVHARQILLYDAEQADEVYQQLQAGNDFGNLALKYDPLTGGELGWFPRGYLPDPKLEEAAFALQPEQYSPVIESMAGFHILQVLERNPQRTLSPEARLVLQAQAVADWLAQRRSESQIEILLP